MQEAIAYDERGLVPCVIQDARTGEVLTLAYMNAEALAKTEETGELHLWSRSREELWRKGATSGNTQAVRALRYDCDADAILALVDPAGPACHTGERTCFFQGDATLTEQEREEAEEVARAAREETEERVAEEAADVLYHLTVLLRTRGLELADAERVLLDRRR
jgi:phosphoribosyl-ATP pyrophosphohydrolase/phosphoribosyl-AMP cyclohydrolase